MPLSLSLSLHFSLKDLLYNYQLLRRHPMNVLMLNSVKHNRDNHRRAIRVNARFTFNIKLRSNFNIIVHVDSVIFCYCCWWYCWLSFMNVQLTFVRKSIEFSVWSRNVIVFLRPLKRQYIDDVSNRNRQFNQIQWKKIGIILILYEIWFSLLSFLRPPIRFA